jgi:hypothetical protein
MDVHDCFYGLWRCVMHRHEHRGLTFSDVDTPVFFPRAMGDADYEYSIEEYFDLEPVDDLPPVTVITRIESLEPGLVRVRGVTSDDYDVARVLVNDRPARATGENFQEWEIELAAPESGEVEITAFAEDREGNKEQLAHTVLHEVKPQSPVQPPDGVVTSKP